jgi:pyruvate dehydrogenase E1 component alpha subunit
MSDPAHPEERLRRLRSLMLARSFEAALLEQAKPGFQLLSRGEEAVAVGLCAALRVTDPLLCGGRSIALALARGVPAGGLLAELLGKDGGPNRGRAGRAHVSMPSVGLFGAHGVVGGNLTVAAGVALGQQQLGTGAVVLCQFGDGACGAGALHETLNIAALWRLPLVLACTNNGYAVSTPARQALAPERITDFAHAFRVPAIAVDGTDVDAVAAAAEQSVRSARDGGGPQFLELSCARMAPHSTLTREERPPLELEELRGRDPLPAYEKQLRADGVLDDPTWERLSAEVRAEIAAAVSFARDAPWPDGEAAVRDA